MTNLLSFPPDAISDPQIFHFTPLIYWWCALYAFIAIFVLSSHIIIYPSRDPDAKHEPFQSNELTLPECPINMRD
jgi:hypothetical protein